MSPVHNCGFSIPLGFCSETSPRHKLCLGCSECCLWLGSCGRGEPTPLPRRGATKPCSRCAPSSLAGVYGAGVRRCVGAVAVPLCEGKAGICALRLLSLRVLSIRVLRLAGMELARIRAVLVDWSCTGQVPEPAAPSGHWPHRERPGMLRSLLALEMWGAGSTLPPCQVGTGFP